MSDSKREEYKLLAKLAEQSERFVDMVENMDQVVTASNGSLSEEERNLLSVAYKNIIGSRRTAWRVYNASYLKEVENKNEEKQKVCKEMADCIEKEILEQCSKIINILDTKLIPAKDNDSAANVFYHKMKGDYNRYKVEICAPGSKQEKEAKDDSETAYKAATNIAKEHLKPTSPIRLGLALNFSVFHYEIAKDPNEACNMAKTAFDDAIAELDDVAEDVYKDSTLIMQLLRDNLTLWKSEMEEDQDDQDIIQDPTN